MVPPIRSIFVPKFAPGCQNKCSQAFRRDRRTEPFDCGCRSLRIGNGLVPQAGQLGDPILERRVGHVGDAIFDRLIKTLQFRFGLGGLFTKTAFLAEKVLGNVVASGVKVLVLAVIIGIGTTLFSQFTTGFPSNPNIEDALTIALASLTLLGLSIFGPGIANGLISGAPQLGAGAAVGTGLAAAGIGAAGFMAARGGVAPVGAVANAAGATARGAAFAASGARSAYGLASAASGESGAAGVAAGLGGVAKAGTGAVMSPLRRAAAKAAGSLQDNYQAGGRAAFAVTSGAPAAPAEAAAASAQAGGAPAWAQRLRRNQTFSHGVTTATHAVSAGDRGGASSAVNLDQEDRS